MLGFWKNPFALVKRDAIAMMWIAFIGVLIVFIPVFLRLAGGIFSPLERMTKTMRRVETGDLTARNNLNRIRGRNCGGVPPPRSPIGPGARTG